MSTLEAARVVLLAGPSGSGKSRLAARLQAQHGWPLVRLDDFYRDEDDPAAPRSTSLGIVDWDDPASWNEDAAVAALEELVRTGRTRTPVYDIAASRAVGTAELTARPTDLILAEGIFAAELVGPLRDRGLLREAYVIHRPRILTFALRLVRDLREHRKPPLLLLRRGLALLRAEPGIIAAQVAKGCVARSPRDVADELAGAPDLSPSASSGHVDQVRD